jgi:hypothetical protein
MEDKNFIFKILTTIFIGLIMVLSISIVQKSYQEEAVKELNINGLQIPSDDFADLIDAVPVGEFKLCDIDERCYLFVKERL